MGQTKNFAYESTCCHFEHVSNLANVKHKLSFSLVVYFTSLFVVVCFCGPKKSINTGLKKRLIFLFNLDNYVV